MIKNCNYLTDTIVSAFDELELKRFIKLFPNANILVAVTLVYFIDWLWHYTVLTRLCKNQFKNWVTHGSGKNKALVGEHAMFITGKKLGTFWNHPRFPFPIFPKFRDTYTAHVLQSGPTMFIQTESVNDWIFCLSWFH